MNFNRHSELTGKHALLGASRYQWLNDDDDQLISRLCRQYTPEVGTILHDFACRRIRYSLKLTKHEKKSIILELLQNGIPRLVVDSLDISPIFDNIMTYVNDCIGFHMKPEVILKYSDICFGTCDAIKYSEKENFLRIHDLKTGTTPARMDQLMVYACLFFLEYKIKPYETDCELRIYQNGEVISYEPTAEDIAVITDKIMTANRIIFENLKAEEG